MELTPPKNTNPLAPLLEAPISNFENDFRNQQLAFVKDDIKMKVDKDMMDFTDNVKDYLHKSANPSPLSDFSNSPLAFNKFDIGIKEAYKPLTTGEYIPMYDNVIGGTNNEERFAKAEGTGEKWLNGITKLFGKTTTAVVGGTVGSVVGIIDWAKTGSFEASYNNGFNDWLDDLNTKMDYKLPNYYTEQEKDNSFLQNMGTANFWANDVLGGASFTVGAIISEGLWAWATGGTSLATAGARQGLRLGKLFGRGAELAEGINKVNSVIKAGVLEGWATAKLPTQLATRFGQAGELLNTARFTYTSAGYESGVEARHYMREAKQEFFNSFESLNGRKPNAQEYAEFSNNLTKAGNNLFAFNMGIVGTSNLAVFGKLLDVKSPLNLSSKWANETLFGIGTRVTEKGAVEALQATRLQNILAKSYSVVKTPLIEGLYEEGMQSSGSNTAKNWVKATYDPRLMHNTVGIGSQFIDGIAQTYGSKEGWKEIGIGMIIGLLSGTGVSVARGQGLFGELNESREAATNEAKVRNDYTAQKLLDRIHTANRVSYFSEEADNAQEKGDITGAELSRASAMLAHITSAYNFGYSKESLKEVKQGIATMDDATLMKQYGLESQDEVQDLKDTLYSDYETLSKEYQKQRQFVDYVIDNNSKEFKEGTVGQVKEAVAYELTLGSKS